MNFSELMDAGVRDFTQFMEDQISSLEPAGLYQPVRYLMRSGGKRFRPMLCLLGCYLSSDEYTRALPQALALELFHNFTLMHDDILDAAPVRRGLPSVHEKWNENTAILSGDVMLILSYQFLLDFLPDESSPSIGRIFSRVARQVCEGQQMDMDFESEDDIGREDYIRMITGKTSVLLGAALQIGAIVGGAEKADAEALYSFGVHAGIAFQIQDDILDVYGVESVVGKRSSGDIINGKKTILYVLSKELANKEDAEQLRLIYLKGKEGDHEKVKAVKQIFGKYKTREKASELQDSYFEKASLALEKVSFSKEKKDLLISLGEMLFKRSF